MRSENVKKFFEAIQKDEKAVERLRALETDVDAFARLAVELGRERGFAFEPSEVQEALAAAAGNSAGELSDQELLAVSGGMGFNTLGYLRRTAATCMAPVCGGGFAR